MVRSLVLGTILGGLVAFLWSNVSWELLHWHESSLMAFQDEDAVARIVLDHTTKSGLYIYPGAQPQSGLTAEQKKAAEAEAMAKMQKGPVVFALEESSRPVFMNVRVGSILPLLTSATGRVFAAFLPEAAVHDLLAMEGSGAQIDEQLVNRVFRAAHSVKGGAGFFGLSNIRELAHKTENALDLGVRVRHGDVGGRKRFIDRSVVFNGRK